MNEPKHKNCIAERDWLRGEYNKITDQLAATEQALREVQRENALLREEHSDDCERLRAFIMCRVDLPAGRRLTKEVTAYAVNLEVELEAARKELRAHRRFHGKVGCPGSEDCYVCALAEPPALSPSKQAAIERGIERAEVIETMQETN